MHACLFFLTVEIVGLYEKVSVLIVVIIVTVVISGPLFFPISVLSPTLLCFFWQCQLIIHFFVASIRMFFEYITHVC